MRTILLLLISITMLSHTTCQSLKKEQNQLNPNDWQRYDRHDGYVIGNGKMYLIAGIGKELARKGKSQLTANQVGLTRIAWVIGPTYSIGNLGYGWELKPTIGNDTLTWDQEKVVSPSSKEPFWGVESKNKELAIRCKDILLPNETVFIRQITVTKLSNSDSIRLHIPVYPDPRNGYYGMYDGKEVGEEQIEKWKHLVGPNLKPRSSIAPDRLIQVDVNSNSMVLVGANHALWQEISTTIPEDEVYSKMFPHRGLATTVITDQSDVKIELGKSGFSVDLGTLKANESRNLYLYIVTETGTDADIESNALAKLNKWKAQDVNGLISQAGKQQNNFLFSTQENTNMIQSIHACIDLCNASKPDDGGVMAQPYMYPMYYVRDQFGSFKLFLAAGQYDKAYDILKFYISKQNQEGIQNAHDLFGEPKDPTFWHPEANEKNGPHAKAEVPSYIILMAKAYFLATGDLKGIEPFYDRLKYNLQVQEPSVNGMLPYAGDESYTNRKETAPKFSNEMTDSHLLFLSSAKFMKELAEAIGKIEDTAEFDSVYHVAKDILFDRMWLTDKNYFAYARDPSEAIRNIDQRPAFDALLRWFYLEIGTPLDTIAQGNLYPVLDQLTNPIRVVPEYEWCAGMDPGYLLYALSRSQHRLAHNAAKLLLNYASDRGLYSEYYRYKSDTIVTEGGSLRPWESAINGYALIQYLTGLRLDMPHRKIYLQPHLPPEWNEWKSEAISLYNEGELRMEIKKINNEVSFSIYRKGGGNPLKLDLEFGLFGTILSSEGSTLIRRNPYQNVIFTETEIPVSEEWTELNYKFLIKEESKD